MQEQLPVFNAIAARVMHARPAARGLRPSQTRSHAQVAARRQPLSAVFWATRCLIAPFTMVKVVEQPRDKRELPVIPEHTPRKKGVFCV